jgi:hypothetical protein
MKRRYAIAIAALLLAPAAALGESERWGSFELGAGTYYPDIDSEPGLVPPQPYQRTFGSSRAWLFRAGLSKALLTRPGALEVGLKTGFFRDSARGFQKDGAGNVTPQRSVDSTTFNFVPTSVTVTYRLDLLADQYGIPFAPYARVAFERYNWWGTTEGGSTDTGATNGWSWSAGIALQLDFFDRGLARELDMDTGINHTYAFFDVTDTHVDDFGSSSSWDLSDEELSLGFGLMFVF